VVLLKLDMNMVCSLKTVDFLLTLIFSTQLIWMIVGQPIEVLMEPFKLIQTRFQVA
jgi:hypothetical protein